MVNYQKLYAYLVGQIDCAVTILESEPEKGAEVKELLKAALLTVEEIYLRETE